MRRLIILALTSSLVLAQPTFAQQAAQQAPQAAGQSSPAVDCNQPPMTPEERAADTSCPTQADPAPMPILNLAEFDREEAPQRQLEFREDSVAAFYNQRHTPVQPSADRGEDLYRTQGSQGTAQRSEYRAFGMRYTCEERADGTRCIGGTSSSTEGDAAAAAAQSEAERRVNERLDAMSRN